MTPKRTLTVIVESGVLDADTAREFLGSQRGRGLLDLLRRLPERDYWELTRAALSRKLSFHIPGIRIYGQAETFARPVTRLYLSPALERARLSEVVTVAAHELGHLLLHHLDKEPGPEEEAEVEEWCRARGYWDKPRIKVEDINI